LQLSVSLWIIIQKVSMFSLFHLFTMFPPLNLSQFVTAVLQGDATSRLF
jgi:hypothetical protein